MAAIMDIGVLCYFGSCSEVYLEKAFDGTGFWPKDRLPVARELGKTSLLVLWHPILEGEHVAKTWKVLDNVMARATR